MKKSASLPKALKAIRSNKSMFSGASSTTYSRPNAPPGERYVADRIRMKNIGELRAKHPPVKVTKWYDIPGMIRGMKNDVTFLWKNQGGKYFRRSPAYYGIK
jgi:hypothetical protein